MSIKFINVADLPSDIPGKTWREKNAETRHGISIGDLVEIIDTGARMFVIKHTRDCDQTPLYVLHPDIEEYNEWKNNEYYQESFSGYLESSLRVIKRGTNGKR